MVPAKGERLSTYRSKRDPNKTPEPMNLSETAPRTRRTPPMFVIQEHHAKALHWDFRLEHDGVLVSWALPKGLPLDPKRNHLAVHTEDHPLEYGSFEGRIPKGEYGGGSVAIWDRGTYDVEKWRDGEVIVVLHGERANGRYVLFATNGKNWMIHRMDPAPRGFSPMPKDLTPMLARTGALPRDDTGWAYEFKWDGVRALVAVEGGRVQATSRNGKGFSKTFPELAEIGEFLGSRDALVDGEIVIFDDDGRPDFGRLAHRLHLTAPGEVKRRSHDAPATLLVFDLLYLEGELLVDLTYDERRARLDALGMAGDRFATPPSFSDVAGVDVLAASKEQHLEGVVAKRRHAPYRPGVRSDDWIKVKNFRTQEVVIGGWTDGNGTRARTFGALLLGVFDGDELRYVGKVGTGFDATGRAELISDLDSISRSTSPFHDPIPSSDARSAHFVAPTIVGEVRFGEWTRDGHLRHPSWRGRRPDKDSRTVVREP